jgi:hypothetical protein
LQLKRKKKTHTHCPSFFIIHSSVAVVLYCIVLGGEKINYFIPTGVKRCGTPVLYIISYIPCSNI